MSASVRESSVVHGSSSEVKLATARITSGELATERSRRPGNGLLSERISVIANSDLRLDSSWAVLISMGKVRRDRDFPT